MKVCMSFKAIKPASDSKEATALARQRIWDEARHDAAKQIEEAVSSGLYLCRVKPFRLLHDVAALVEELKRLGYGCTHNIADYWRFWIWTRSALREAKRDDAA